MERTVAELGGIDILINNAGIGAFAPIDTFILADFDRIFAVNVSPRQMNPHEGKITFPHLDFLSETRSNGD